ncbi:MAG: DUF2264 domain-containing protein [Bryobacteraceae bacterium]|nr:DUF2264 domain-containing protein [Bryobacteraceae bacterium]
MRRREFLAALPCSAALGQSPGSDPSFNALAEIVFLELVRGYVTNAAKTSDSNAVIEYPGATVTKNFLAKSGKSVTGVTRMLPALASWIVSKRQPGVLAVDGAKFDLLDVVGSALVNGTNPAHKDYWLAAPPDKQDQRQVESSIVAWSVWLLRDALLPQMSTVERRRIDEWLSGCTVVPVRRNNWAWFTAVNHAARLSLNEKFSEFSYGQTAMFEDLKALDAMYVGNGWYNDDKPRASFDYYNSWVFASHFLYWNAMVGAKFPDWSKMFGDRLKSYLETAPLFFGANGSHVLYGRSLIYRWAVLTPLVLAYSQNLWPHSDALLHRIVHGSLAFHKNTGGFDASAGKLRETYSADGTVDIHESYIDGGHPYWGMQAFGMWLIPRTDPFWTAAGGQLPVEQSDFRRGLEAPGLMLTGHKASGQVKMLQARSTRTDWHYRDKYNKLVYSTHFPFNIVQAPDVCPWDNCLVLRDRRRRKSAGRGEVSETRMLTDGVELAYGIEYEGLKVSVRSTVIADGEFELRVHRVIAPAEVDAAMELVEGSAAIGLDSAGQADTLAQATFSIVRNPKSGMLIASWPGTMWSGVGASWDFGSAESAASNVISKAMLVNTLWAPLKPGAAVLYSVHYASPKPLTHPQLHAGAARLMARAKSLTGVAGPERMEAVDTPLRVPSRVKAPAAKR